MKFTKIAAAAVAVSAMAGAASAADLPVRAAPAYVPPPPVFTWAGLYVGANAGATFGGNGSANTVAGPLSNRIPGVGGSLEFQAAVGTSASGFSNTGSNTAGLLGVQVGYNWQFGPSFVLGLEADVDGVLGSNSRGTFANTVGLSPAVGVVGSSITSVGTVSRRLDWLSTVRARIGYAFSPTWLVYATGGLAVGGVKSNTLVSTFFTGPAAGVSITGFSGGYSNTRVGWTVGGGVEWMFAPNWSMKAEYLYYDLGSISYFGGASISSTPAFPNFSNDVARTRIKADGHVARLGVNYHFTLGGSAAPVVARY